MMDVLDPAIEIIDGIPYRVNHSDDFNALKEAETAPYIEFGEENEVECAGDMINEEEGDVHVEYQDDGYYLINVHIPRDYHSVLIGSKGATKKRLEYETKAQIDIPKKNENVNMPVEIKGRSRVGVLAAHRKIKALVDTARLKTPFTHFISIPMTGPQIVKNFIKFKEEVLDAFGKNSGITESLFQNPAKLHLTVAIMLLADEKERTLAYNTMIACKEEIINPMFKGHALKVRVRGLEIMNDDPSEVRVLYGKVEDPSDGLLQELVDRIVEYFVDADLIAKSRDSVKMHLTLMSSVFASKKMHGINKNAFRGAKYHYFNASKIFELYKHYDFGEMEISKIHLSQRHNFDTNGYWCSSCRLTFY